MVPTYARDGFAIQSHLQAANLAGKQRARARLVRATIYTVRCKDITALWVVPRTKIRPIDRYGVPSSRPNRRLCIGTVARRTPDGCSVRCARPRAYLEGALASVNDALDANILHILDEDVEGVGR